jgi:three-Cys-motif partner protein
VSNRRFFEEQGPQSEVKTLLVTKYLRAWAKVMLGTKHPNKRIAYVDLFCGPGEYADGTPSTPAKLLEMVLADDDLARNLTMFFNDIDPAFTSHLDELIGNYPDIERLSHRPEVHTSEVSSSIFDELRHLRGVPTLFFLDPCGYKGLSQDLVHRALEGWGCDCILFFNYNRVNGAVSNPVVRDTMRDLFGDRRFGELLVELERTLTPEQRQTTIVGKYQESLKDVNGAYILPFEFQTEEGVRTSHYVFLVTKHFRGYSIMKDIMYRLSSDSGDVRRLKYVPALPSQLRFFRALFSPEDPYSIDILQELLLRELSGKSLRVGDIYERYSVDTPYTERNFKAALLEMEHKGLLIASTPPMKRPKRQGKATLADHLTVTFN